MGIGRTHYASLFSTMRIPALGHTAQPQNREREAGNAVESIAKRTCQRYAKEEKELTKKGNQATVKMKQLMWHFRMICHGARGARHLTGRRGWVQSLVGIRER